MTTRPFHSRVKRGLTLVEMLVALVILGFVLTLVAQAVQQVSQLVRAAETTTRAITGGWSGAWVLQPTLANLVLPVEKYESGFKGRSERIEAFSARPLDGSTTGVKAFALELRRAAQNRAEGGLEGGPKSGQTTEIWATHGTDQPVQASTQMVAQLDGLLEFVYVDEAGLLSPVWPPASGLPVVLPDLVLPSAIGLRRVDSQALLMWFGIEGEKLRPKPASKPFWE